MPVTALLVLPAVDAPVAGMPDPLRGSLDVLAGCPAVSTVRQVEAGFELAGELRSSAGADVLLVCPGWHAPTPEAVAALLTAMDGDPGACAVVAVVPVTDSLRFVDPDGFFAAAAAAAADRDRFVAPAGPVAYRRALLPPDLPSHLWGEPEAVPAALLAQGARVLAVPVPGR